MKKFFLTCCLLQWALFALHAQSVNKQLENVPTTYAASIPQDGLVVNYETQHAFTDTSNLVKLPVEVFNAIKNLDRCTIAIEVSLGKLSAGKQIVLSCSNSKGEHFNICTENDQFGVDYDFNDGTHKHGHWTKGGLTSYFHRTILITMDPTGKNDYWADGYGAYSFYTSATWQGTYDVNDVEKGGGFGIFKNIIDADGIYIGGMKGQGGKKELGFTGAIHSIRVWSKVFSDKKIHEGITSYTVASGKVLFETRSSKAHPEEGPLPYRIPAIAKASDGTLIAVADHRICKDDVGHGEIDLKYRLSKDNGITWTDEQMLADGLDADHPYGDAAIVADRESNEVLVLSCSAKQGITYHSKGDGITRDLKVFATRSHDNGTHWDMPVDITDKIYDLFNGFSVKKKLDKLFVTSGKIAQSRLYKKGSHYRIYCVILGKNIDTGTIEHKKVENFNAVIYSDDFGENWHLLGEIDPLPVPVLNNADEAKAEEMPDGSVLVSSRNSDNTTSGRIFNLFNYTDAQNGKGFWGIHKYSNASNGGIACGEPTNGEILCIPVVRNDNPRPIYLLLQSVPLGEGRSQVGIYYKPLIDLADFNLPRNLAKNWEGKFVVTDQASAYSSMVMQDDHKIGFIYENGYNVPNVKEGYNIFYLKYDIETITGGKYHYCAETESLRKDFVKNNISRKLELLKKDSGHDYIGMYSKLTKNNINKVNEAITTYLNDQTEGNYNNINVAIKNGENKAVILTLEENGVYRLINDASDLELTAKANGNDVEVNKQQFNNTEHYFTFSSVEGIPNTYTIQSLNHGWYLGTMCSEGKYGEHKKFKVDVTKDVTLAGRFEISSTDNGLSKLLGANGGPFHHYIDSKTSYQYLSINSSELKSQTDQPQPKYVEASGTELIAWKAKDYWNSKDWTDWRIERVLYHEVQMNGSNGEYWSSLYLPYDVQIPEGTQAYIGKENKTHDVIRLKSITDVPERTGAILKSNEKVVKLPIIDRAKSDVKGNNLEGTLEPKSVIWKEYYTLGSGSKGVGMYRPRRDAGSTTNSTIPRNKAFYHPTAAAETPAFYLFSFGDDMTDIDEVETTPAQQEEKVTVYYDLSGRRVMNPTHGIYIANGRKVYIK